MMKNNPEVLLIGCGKLGKPLAITLQQLGFNVTVFRKSQQYLSSITTVVGNVLDEETFTKLPKKKFDVVFYILTPSEYTEKGYKNVFERGVVNLLRYFKNRMKPGRIIFISSTRVYGQKNNEWVDESSETAPTSWAGQTLLKGENLFLTSNIDSTIVRFAGIYGPGRNRLIKKVKNKTVSEEKPVSYSNRIHSDDCVGFLTHLAKKVVDNKSVESIYIGVDDSPAPIHDVMMFIAKKLNIIIEKTEKNNRPSKRCKNIALSQSGYKLKYPDYQSGYIQVLQNNQVDKL